MPELPLLTNEDLSSFLKPFSELPVLSGIETDLHLKLQIDIAAGLFQRAYYVVRLFPALSEESANALKDQFAEQVQAMAASGQDISQLPISLEDMRSRNAREFNSFPIWRLESLGLTLSQIQGYVLTAVRHMPDPALSIPCVMFSYEKEGQFPIDVILLTASLNPRFDAVLKRAQMLSSEQAAIAQIESDIEQPKIEVPGEARSEGGIILTP